MLFLHALTGLHPGSGSSLGFVDLPVQRERHTQWPVIPGSSLKGVLRSECRADASFVKAAFGPETQDADKAAGALSFTDARILAYPVRSLRGVFAWVTCSAVISRLKRDLELAGVPAAEHPAIGDAPASETALCESTSPLLLDGKRLLLEEFEFTRAGDAGKLPAWIQRVALGGGDTAKDVASRVVVLHDDDFTHFVRFATEVVARVGLDSEKKTVRNGALFYEEFLPPETLFYSLVLAGAARDGSGRGAGELLRSLGQALPPVIQVGADETIGRGFCAVRFVGGDA